MKKILSLCIILALLVVTANAILIPVKSAAACSVVANTGGPYSGVVNKAVTFDASKTTGSSSIISYTWDFGDGTTGSGKIVNHIYKYTGKYTVTLTAKCSFGHIHSATTTVTVNFEDRYAIIMVGRYYGQWSGLTRVRDDIQTHYNYYLSYAGEMYKMLIDKYNYKPENIYLLAKLLPSQFTIPSDFNPAWIYNQNPLAESLEVTMKKIIDNIKTVSDSSDSFLFFFQDHGANDKSGNTYFGCPFTSLSDWFKSIFGSDEERLYDYELASYVSGIKARMIFLLQPCFSGGFIDNLKVSSGYPDSSVLSRIVLTASQNNEVADGPWTCEIFETFNGNRPSADYNSDGMYSLLEAHKRASFRVDQWYNEDPANRAIEHPLLDDNGDGFTVYKNDVNYNPLKGQDGYIADRTFLYVPSSTSNYLTSDSLTPSSSTLDSSTLISLTPSYSTPSSSTPSSSTSSYISR